MASLQVQKVGTLMTSNKYPVCGGPGDYITQIMIAMPPHWFTKKSTRLFWVDGCIANEISEIVDKGVRTIECCCGHGRDEIAYITVEKESIQRMIDLGYTQTKDVPEEIQGTVFGLKQKIIHIGPERKNG